MYSRLLEKMRLDRWRVFDRRYEVGPHGRRYIRALRRLPRKLGYM